MAFMTKPAARRRVLAVAMLLLGTAPQGQEPSARPADRPAPPPADAPPLPPVDAPYVEGVPRFDLPERFTARDPLEGVWELRQRTADGQPVVAGVGHLFIGRRFLIAAFQAPGVDPDTPLLRTGTYTWSRIDAAGTVRTTVVAGHYNDVDGDVSIEVAGTVEERRFELLDGALRVVQPSGDRLEFARVE